MEPLKAIFKLDRSTKNTHRFAEVTSDGEFKGKDDDKVVGMLYIQKDALKDVSITDETIVVATLDISDE